MGGAQSRPSPARRFFGRALRRLENRLRGRPQQRRRRSEADVCKYKPDEVTGTTPKFDCVLENGEKFKVKYGYTQRDSLRDRRARACCTRWDLAPTGSRESRRSAATAVRSSHFIRSSLWELMGVTDFMDKRIDYDTLSRFRAASASSGISRAKRSRWATNAAGDSTS